MYTNDPKIIPKNGGTKIVYNHISKEKNTVETDRVNTLMMAGMSRLILHKRGDKRLSQTLFNHNIIYKLSYIHLNHFDGPGKKHPSKN